MKRICVSAGLAALGAAAAHAQYAPGLSSTETTKPWALTASIRGFYDDNYLTLPKTIPQVMNGATNYVHGARDSYGTELTPSVAYNKSLADTLLSATYTYDMQWYNDGSGTTDQSHQFNAKLSHQFSERYKVELNESFVDAQEPTVIDPAVISTPLRITGNNIRNTATADFTAQLTRLFDLHLGYGNTVYAYQQTGSDEFPAFSYPSYSALLDRMDQTYTADLRWKALRETTGVLGYQYEDLAYTSPEWIILPGISPLNGKPATPFRADSRNDRSQFMYVGVDQSFSPTLNASLRVGGEYLDYYNYGTTSFSPYADGSVVYQYMPQSQVQAGVKHAHNSTDVGGFSGTTPVLDEETTTAYISVNHRVTSRFTASLMAQAQYSTYNGGGILYNGVDENLYLLSLNLAYHFTPWLSGETGYSFTKLNSDAPTPANLATRSYTRDQIYIGVRATY